MDEIRKGQIALLYLKNKIREEGVRLTPNMKRQVGNTAKAIGISVEEAMEFTEILVRELVEETFPKEKISDALKKMKDSIEKAKREVFE
ncbi:MAG: hypothetical protein WA055_01030 [Candidatus Moraniibacteriota bacterium]